MPKRSLPSCKCRYRDADPSSSLVGFQQQDHQRSFHYSHAPPSNMLGSLKSPDQRGIRLQSSSQCLTFSHSIIFDNTIRCKGYGLLPMNPLTHF